MASVKKKISSNFGVASIWSVFEYYPTKWMTEIIDVVMAAISLL